LHSRILTDACRIERTKHDGNKAQDEIVAEKQAQYERNAERLKVERERAAIAQREAEV
jgi:hypothetical protein